MHKAVVDIAADAKRPFQYGDLRPPRVEHVAVCERPGQVEAGCRTPLALRWLEGVIHCFSWGAIQNAVAIRCIVSRRTKEHYPR